MPATYEKIATTTLGSAQGTITFSSIPSTYTDLRLVMTFTTTAGELIKAQYNGDTATNYSVTSLYGDGSTAGSFRVTSINYVYVTNGSDTTVPHFATLDIFSYAGSTNKTSLGTQSRDNNGSGTVGQFVHLWGSTSAINSIALFPNSGNFKTGTTATLYGILKA
jgi:hypothetical protein